MLTRVFLILLIVLTAFCNKKNQLPEEVSFTNPLLPVGPDPFVLKVDSFYYYMHTLGNRIELWRTKSMSRLSAGEHKVIWRPPSVGPNAHNIWAPELHYFDGKWYMYYTAGPTPQPNSQRLFVLENSSADPFKGIWLDKGKIADSTSDLFAIDATVLEYKNKRYLLWSSTLTNTDDDQRIYCAEFLNPWTLATHRSLISSPNYYWERFESPPAKGVNEAPQILVNPKGKIFVIFSASECWSDGYGLGMISLKENGDPLKQSDWVKNPNPVFKTAPLSSAYGPGHNAFFKSPDGKEDWIIYHANSQARQHCANFRNPRMQKFSWKDDGTPNFGDPVPIERRLFRPSGEKD